MTKQFLLICLMTAFSLLAAQENSYETKTILVNENVSFDLYLPNKSDTKFACVLCIQGGGFKARNGNGYKKMAKFFAEKGFAAASLPYRGLPEHTYRETMNDIQSSVQHLRENLDEYNLSGKIGAMGHSAGATLAVLTALSSNDNIFSTLNAHLDAAVGSAGVYDFVARFSAQEQLDLQAKHEEKIKSNGAWIGVEFAKENKDWMHASAQNHADKDDPAILLLQSDDDPIVPWMQSSNLHKHLQSQGIQSEYIQGTGRKHAMLSNAKTEMLKFFKAQLY